MDDDPIESVYSYVERAYVRLQAGDLLIRCLEEDSSTPMSQLVEGLVLAGPGSIDALREILAEAGRRKLQIQDDLYQLMKDLQRSLGSYGLIATDEQSGMDLIRMSPMNVLVRLRKEGIKDQDTQAACLRLLHDSRDLIESLNSRLLLLEEIELYLEDWLWGVAYQSTRQDANSSQTIIN